MRMSFQYTFVLHTKSINFLDASISVYVHVLDIINFLDTSISVNVCIIHIIEDTLILVYIFTQTINSKDASISVYVRIVQCTLATIIVLKQRTLVHRIAFFVCVIFGKFNIRSIPNLILCFTASFLVSASISCLPRPI